MGGQWVALSSPGSRPKRAPEVGSPLQAGEPPQALRTPGGFESRGGDLVRFGSREEVVAHRDALYGYVLSGRKKLVSTLFALDHEDERATEQLPPLGDNRIQDGGWIVGFSGVVAAHHRRYLGGLLHDLEVDLKDEVALLEGGPRLTNRRGPEGCLFPLPLFILFGGRGRRLVLVTFLQESHCFGGTSLLGCCVHRAATW